MDKESKKQWTLKDLQSNFCSAILEVVLVLSYHCFIPNMEQKNAAGNNRLLVYIPNTNILLSISNNHFPVITEKSLNFGSTTSNPIDRLVIKSGNYASPPIDLTPATCSTQQENGLFTYFSILFLRI